MNNGYIRLHRKFLEWEWLQNPNDVSLFIHLLLMANWKESKYKDVDVPRGSLVTGRKELAKQVGISEQQVRTSLNHLKSTNVITINSYTKFSIILINNYDKYQESNQEDNQQVTNNQPTSNQQVTTYEESKKEKKKENNNIYDEEFNELWKIYPIKQGKTDAKKKYVKYRKEGVTYEEVLKGLKDYVAYIKQKNIELQYIKYGSTWFNQKCWEDEYDVEQKDEPKIKQVGEGVFQF